MFSRVTVSTVLLLSVLTEAVMEKYENICGTTISSVVYGSVGLFVSPQYLFAHARSLALTRPAPPRLDLVVDADPRFPEENHKYHGARTEHVRSTYEARTEHVRSTLGKPNNTDSFPF